MFENELFNRKCIFFFKCDETLNFVYCFNNIYSTIYCNLLLRYKMEIFKKWK